MLYTSLTLLLFVQAECEWVEISQQHYQKPLKMQNHPFLATIGKASETIPPHLQATVKPTNESVTVMHRPQSDTVRKVNDDERGTKRNRIYINHTLSNNNWDIGSVQRMPANESSDENHEIVNRKPTVSDEIVVYEEKSKEDILIIRKPKPDQAGKPEHRTYSVAGNLMRVRPPNNKGSLHIPKPLDQYKGPIEVLNLSDLEDTTAEDTFDIKLDKTLESTVKHKQNVTNTTPKAINRRKQESSKPESVNDQQKSRPHELITRQPIILQGVTNIRRVEILRSTEPTPIKDFDDDDDYGISRPPSSPKFDSINDVKAKHRGTGTTQYKFPNLGHVKRVHIANNTTKVTRKPKPDNKHTVGKSVIGEFNVTEQSDEYNKIRTVNKPTSLHKSTTKQTFPIRTKPGKLIFENRDKSQVPTVPSPEDVMLDELITSDEKQFEIKVHKFASIEAVKRVPNPTKAPNKDKNKHDRHDPINRFTEPTPVIETDDDMTVDDEDSNNNFNVYKKHDFTSNTEKIPTKLKPNQNAVSTRSEISPQIETNPYKPEFITKENSFKNNAEFETTSRNNIETTRNKIKTDSRQENRWKNNAAKDKPQTDDIDEQDKSEDPLSNDRKNNAMENLIKFLKTVTEIIAKNTRRGVHGKMRYLEDLRDTIMANIEERLEAEFPDDTAGAPGTRRARSAEPRGHVEFPSSEGALMTISFLTFAVFLIKLVLQVIQAYKNKTMMMMPTVVAAVGRTYTDRRNHN